MRLAEAQLGLAGQDLVTRVATAYFDVLSAQDAVEVAEAQRRAISEQFESAKRNFEVGTATITDQQEAQARLDLNAAQLAAARNDLTVRNAALAQLTGLAPSALNTLSSRRRCRRQPNDIDNWTARARDGSYPCSRRNWPRPSPGSTSTAPATPSGRWWTWFRRPTCSRARRQRR